MSETEKKAAIAGKQIAPGRMPFEKWAEKKPHKLVTARMAAVEMGWPIGAEVTEAEYDAACVRVATTPIGYQMRGVSRGVK